MRGLDPRIHPLRKEAAPAQMMGCRVKPGNDEGVKPGNDDVATAANDKVALLRLVIRRLDPRIHPLRNEERA